LSILAEDIARVRAATDFVAVVSEHLGLRRVGRRWVGLCPFHAERTPSFSVNAEEGLYHCFGCGAGGDAIRFVQEVEHLPFADAVERLAARAGITVRHDTLAATQERHRRTRLVEAMTKAVEWYHDRLLHATDAAGARAYLRARGYDGEVVRRYQLGWAPDAWDALARTLSVPDEVLVDTGLGLRNSRGRQQDTFRARVLFPIFDVRGHPVGFGGRQLEGGPPPKYRNSPETPLYAKSRVLYGLNWAKGDIVAEGEVVVCEGYTDVIGLSTVGIGRSVATCGTSLTEDHFRMLKNFARRMVLAYDADAAGQQAAERFYEWERRHELDVAVAALPPGSDPGDLARRDPEALRRAVAEARPFLAFRVERVLAAADLRAPEGRARAAEAALAALAPHPGDLVRDQYLMTIADRVRIPPERLRAVLAGLRSGEGGAGSERLREPAARAATASARTTQPVPSGPEVEALRLALQRPADMEGRLHDVLFADPLVTEAYGTLVAAPSLHEALQGASEEAAALLRRLAVEDTESDPAEVTARLGELAAARCLRVLEREMRASDEPLAYAEEVGWLKLTLEQCREPATAEAATGALVRWIVARRGEAPH